MIIPSLFPFFVLASLCIALGLAGYMGQYLSPLMRPLFGVSGSGATALVLGLVGGYPLGAKAVASLYENGSCTEEEANRLLRFCNNSGPAFVVGAAGAGVFGSTILGLWLYAAHVVAAILTGLLLCRGKPKGPAVPPSIQTSKAQPLSIALVESIKSAFSSVHSICAFVVFFSVAIQLLQSAGILALATEGLVSLGLGQDVAAGLTAGLLEISSGITALQGTPSIGALCAAGFILGWSGLSVHCQAISILSPAGLSARPLILGKLVHGLFSALLIFAGCSLFSGALPVMAPVHTMQKPSRRWAACSAP